jgi:hypothetical protein
MARESSGGARQSKHGWRRLGGDAGPERLVCVPEGSAARVVADLAAALAEPYAVVYVLLESGALRPEGRWQSTRPLGREALRGLLERFGPFLDADGRHGLWVISAAEPGGVALDRRGVVSVHGTAVSSAPTVLAALGLFEAEVEPPPARVRRAELDLEEARLLSAIDWTWNALEPGDDALE